jgi:hypothetical protein
MSGMPRLFWPTTLGRADLVARLDTMGVGSAQRARVLQIFDRESLVVDGGGKVAVSVSVPPGAGVSTRVFDDRPTSYVEAVRFTHGNQTFDDLLGGTEPLGKGFNLGQLNFSFLGGRGDYVAKAGAVQ